MKHSINPLVDCVFKALLGDAKTPHLTADFLNAIIKPKFPIQDIRILNPYNEREFWGDKLTIVDIKAKDSAGNSYQIEVQLAVFSYLPARMLYTWSDIYRAELVGGENFNLLEPVVSIWLLDANLFRDSNHHHHFQAYDPLNEVTLSDHFAIHVLELAKWQKTSDLLNKEDQWLYFFQQAKSWDHLPKALDNPEMRQAMQVLNRFSEKQKHYDMYQARANAMRDQVAKKQLLEKAEQQRQEAERQKKEAERLKDEAEQREKEAERLRDEAERLRDEAEQREKQAKRLKNEAEQREKEAQQQKEEAQQQTKEAQQQKEVAERREKETEVKMGDAVREAETERSEKERLLTLLQKAGIDYDKGQ